jgi:Peptidase family M23
VIAHVSPLTWLRSAGALLHRAGGRRRSRGGCCLAAALSFGGCVGAAALVAVTCLGAIVAVVSAGLPGTTAVCSTCVAWSVAPMSCAGVHASQGFGNTPWEHPHTGIDIVCPAGTAVASISTGTLYRLQGSSAPCLFPTGRRGGLGTFAEVVSGSVAVLYGHLAVFAVPNDAVVSAGTVIGYEGDTGCATGPHLHLQVDQGSVPVDPCPYLPPGYPAVHDGARCWGAAPP